METRFDDPVKQEAWETVRRLNDCWTKGDGTGLVNYFHKDMVAITPTDRLRREGRLACVEGWSAFAATAKTLTWAELDPRIQIYGTTAVVTYYYAMTVQMGGQTLDLSGRDMMVLVKEDDKWQAVADHFSSYPG